MSKTVFTTCLKALFDDTNLFSRKEWSDILGFSQSHIEEWVSGTLFPSPGILRMIVDAVDSSFNAEQKPLDEFKNLYEKRLPEQEINFPVQTMANFLGYLDNLRLGEYILLPVLDGFLRNLKTLPLDLQEQLLFHFAEACRLHVCAQKPVSEDVLREINASGNLNNEEVINRINAHQKNEMLHPLTCRKNSLHALLEPIEKNGRVILICPTCGHKQVNWPTFILEI